MSYLVQNYSYAPTSRSIPSKRSLEGTPQARQAHLSRKPLKTSRRRSARLRRVLDFRRIGGRFAAPMKTRALIQGLLLSTTVGLGSDRVNPRLKARNLGDFSGG